jgi:hypothetical protein
MKTLILALLPLITSCGTLSYGVSKAVLDKAFESEPKHTIVENRIVNVTENKEVKVVNINVKEKEDLKHSEDVQLGQKRVFFYPNP